MREQIQTFTADEKILLEFYNQPLSATRHQRMRRFYEESLEAIEKLDFESLDRTAQIDYVLFKNLLRARLRQIEIDAQEASDLKVLLPFAQGILNLVEPRQKVDAIEPEICAVNLKSIVDQIPQSPTGEKTQANLAAKRTDEFCESLREWFEFYNAYDPLFTWWCQVPFQAADKALEDYAKHLRENLVGIASDDNLAIIGKPIGREALIAALEAEMIPYTPEELIDLGKKEYAWCEAEMKRAAQEMGCGDDWRAALELTKQDHLKPGEQPRFIRELTEEAIQFVKDHDLMTIPPLAEEVWRMKMMSPAAQKVNPFFLGGDTIIVSFPTNDMTQEEKLKSLRANNRHFARATVFHELIPGHHLQAYIEERNYPYRSIFYTPFWTEGWALWMEFLFWNLGFPQTPQNRVGMLFWRMHRCVRIEFSLGFHLGLFTPEECIEMLVHKVGHEPGTAEGEVRRSFKGDYPPLYQAAYMLGAMQMRALAKECLEEKGMTHRQFHDAILAENNMPIPVLRAILTDQPLTREFNPGWRFEG